MSSFIISVSLCKGCYRHIQISASAKLYRLHKTILKAFEFDDDHMHAFFMDNKLWSPAMSFMSSGAGGKRTTKGCSLGQFFFDKGYAFKYLFDFGDEWVFQCKILREVEEDVATPLIIKAVGDPPPQYPDYDDYYEEYDEYLECDDDQDEYDEEEEIAVIFPEIYSAEKLYEMHSAISLPQDTISDIKSYFQAAARLYGILSVGKLFEIYNAQNEPILQKDFLQVAEIIFHQELIEYTVYGHESLYLNAEPSEPMDREIIAQHLVIDGPEDYYELKEMQEKKELNILSKEEFIKYEDPDYYPITPQSTEMLKYLKKRLGEDEWAQDILLEIQDMTAMDFSLDDILKCLNEPALNFKNTREANEFIALYQELNNHTRKHANRGYSPYELMSLMTKKRKNIDGQTNMFE